MEKESGRLKLSNRCIQALEILSEYTYNEPISAMGFADKFWKDSDTNMFTSSKNTGNGACRGKAAWLCAGSYLAKLRKKGLVTCTTWTNGYLLSFDGKKILNEIKNQN